MRVKERFSITEFTNPSGAKVFRVQGLKVTGERVRLNFATYAEAIGTKSRLELESHNLLADRVPRVTSMTPGQIAKMRQRRVVEISDNLVAWLKPHQEDGDPLVSGNWRRDFDTIKAIAGFSFAKHRVNLTAVRAALPGIDAEDLSKRPRWTVDILRHTGISYHLARFQHEGRTATWAGNSPDMIQRHYKGLVRPKAAASQRSASNLDRSSMGLG